MRQQPSIFRWEILLLLALSVLSLTGIDATQQKQVAANKITHEIQFSSTLDPQDQLPSAATAADLTNFNDPNTQL